MSVDPSQSRVTQAADALRGEAREHKRLSGYHRRRARELMALAAGIDVTHAQPEEAQHGTTAHP